MRTELREAQQSPVVMDCRVAHAPRNDGVFTRICMTIARDIIEGRIPNFDNYIKAGETLDDIDEYGFTPLIETVIMAQMETAELLLARNVDVNKPDVTGRTALHWAIDNEDIPFCELLLNAGASPNAYTRAGLSPLVYPVLRGQQNLKQLLYKYGAYLNFSLDFIYAKLLGHRFSLTGYVDIVTAEGKFIEVDYEGFILEFTIAVMQDSLRRFTGSYSTRHLRNEFPYIHNVMDAVAVAAKMLRFQHLDALQSNHLAQITRWLKHPLVFFPVASRGHAMSFLRFGPWWAKIDRGENSTREGSINIYQILNPHVIDAAFVEQFLFKKQSRDFFHKEINHILDLKHFATIPMSSQISGNCSWANIQAIMPTAYVMQYLDYHGKFEYENALSLYETWLTWDQDRAMDECIARFYQADNKRKASIAALLGAILFQACDWGVAHHIERAEKILKILTIPEYYYVLESYLNVYCVKQLTRRGNNLLKLLDDCGVNPNIGVTPIATGLE